jgi:hypothetical protein
MNIKYEDIRAIMYAVCYANTLLNSTIEDLKKRGLNNVADKYTPEKEKIKKAMDSLQKIRKELHLKDDYAYNEAFGK